MSDKLPQRRSALHRKVVGLIREAFPNFTVYEDHPVKVRLSGRDSTLYVDIVVKELNLAVECHGRQHFEFVPHFHGSRDNFARARERDAAKAAGLVVAGFTFLVIRFDEEVAMEMSHLLARITQAISETTE